MTSSEKVESREIPVWRYGLIWFALAVVFWAANWMLVYFQPSIVLGDTGRLGDSFGIVNSLFSGLAFAGLIVAILLQRNELLLQRQEIKLNRFELEGQREQLEGQREQLELQNIENRFFKLLDFYNGQIEDFRLGSVGKSGRSCLSYFREQARQTYKSERSKDTEKNEIEVINVSLRAALPDFMPTLVNSIRSLYHAFKLVDRSKLSVADQRFYGNVLRSILSSDELVVLFYLCLSTEGKETFKPILEKFGTFKHLDRQRLFIPAHWDLYESSAYSSFNSAS